MAHGPIGDRFGPLFRIGLFPTTPSKWVGDFHGLKPWEVNNHLRVLGGLLTTETSSWDDPPSGVARISDLLMFRGDDKVPKVATPPVPRDRVSYRTGWMYEKCRCIYFGGQAAFQKITG